MNACCATELIDSEDKINLIALVPCSKRQSRVTRGVRGVTFPGNATRSYIDMGRRSS